MTARNRTFLFAALALTATLPSAAPATAGGLPEFVHLGGGTFASPPVRWDAHAIEPNTIFLDLYDEEDILFQTYAPSFTPAPAPKGLSALGYRPGGLPTPAALVGGVAGTKVKRVKILFRGAPAQTIKPTAIPASWNFRGRFFAAGTSVGPSAVAVESVVKKIKALDRKGRVVSTQKNVPTSPF